MSRKTPLEPVKKPPEGPHSLGVLIHDTAELAREYRRRRKDFDFTSVAPARADQLLREGWERAKKLRKRLRLRRPKHHEERLQNRVWCLLYKLRYPELSQGHDFFVLIRRKGEEDYPRQVDIFAKDEETVVVVQCDSRASLGEKDLQQEIEEFSSLKGAIARAVKQHYGPGFKPKVVWLFVTDNIVWSKKDVDVAERHSIHRITERELRYFNQLADHLGPAARYQFLAEFLEGQKIPELSGKKTPAVRGRLGGKHFYSFVSTPKYLLKVAFVNHRSLNDPDGLPTYQRLVGKTRINRIGRFIESGGFFPTNILLNLKRKCRFEIVSRDPESGVQYGYLYLPDSYKTAWVIDGQHRLYGYSRLAEKYLNQNLMVVAFEALGIEEEANLFVTINHEQKSVPRTLLDDLEGDLKWGSTVPTERVGAIAARLIALLNNDIGEPFFNRVTAQGIKATAHTCLTVPGIKLGLKRSGLIGRSTHRGREYEPGPLAGSTDSATLDRARRFLNLYFKQVQESNFELWHRGREGFLCTNVGIHGHLQLLASLIDHLEEDDQIDCSTLAPEELLLKLLPYLSPIMDQLRAGDEEWAQEAFKVPYGAGGPPNTTTV